MKVKAMPQKPSLDGKTLLTTIHSSSLLRMFLDSLNLQKHGLYCSPEEFQAIQNPFVLEMLYIISMDLMWPLDIKNILKNHDNRGFLLLVMNFQNYLSVTTKRSDRYLFPTGIVFS